MAARRSRGKGGVHWSESRKRWIATAQLGFQPHGKRIVKTATGTTKTEAKARLRALTRDREDGITASARMTVAAAVEDWLEYGLSGRSAKTIATCRFLAQAHIVPELGARTLDRLTAEDVDRWLAKEAAGLSRSTLQRLLSILRRALARQVARDRLRRNVALLCEVPQGTGGRPSKSLTLPQATALLNASAGTDLAAYITVSLLTGTRTEELRALTWADLDLEGMPDAHPPAPPTMQVGRSVRRGGDTKTRRSRRTLRLPERCVDGLTRHRALQEERKARAGDGWQDHDLVFHDPSRDPARRVERARRVPPRRGCSRTRPNRAGPPGTSPQLRVDPVRCRRASGGHRPARRSPQHHGHGGGVPQAAATGPDRGRGGHGPYLPGPRPSFQTRSLVKQLVKHRA